MFKKAVPVWTEGEAEALNSQLVLRAETGSDDCELWITASSFYRLTVNGKFAAFGPARAAGGYARVDRIDLKPYLSGHDEIIIEVAGYHCRSLSTVLEKNYVIAEVRKGNKVLLATGGSGGFQGYRSCRRLQKVERYSFQRHFGEIWDEREPDPFAGRYQVSLTPVPVEITFIPRGVPEPDHRFVNLQACSGTGKFLYDENLPCRNNRYSIPIDPYWGKFEESEIEYFPYRWIQRQALHRQSSAVRLPVTLKENEYVIFDFEKIQVGFLHWAMEASAESEVVIGFSEMCFEKDFEFSNINCQNVIQIILPGDASRSGDSFEPYSFRYCILMVKKGKLRLTEFGVRNDIRDMSGALTHEIRDPELREIYDAAVRTFSHNAVDLFFDCPSRERAGWLCDSFFSGRVEYFLFGKTPAEDAFLENYRLYRNRGEYPDGILPMVYPSDRKTDDKLYIPQWNLWYILEVAEYLTNRNPAVDRDLFRESIFGILHFFERFENADGLLQKLSGWNFIEWSDANHWGWDVNYPTNFLYAQALEETARLYDEPQLSKKADRIRKAAAEKSFDGFCFVDHAVLNEYGELENLTDTSEAGQYYAILYGGIDISDEKYKELKEQIFNGFEDERLKERNFVPVNAFIGFYLRIMVLMKLGEQELLSRDLKRFFHGMMSSTGTLWEYKVEQRKGSYDHGFASFAAIAAVFADRL